MEGWSSSDLGDARKYCMCNSFDSQVVDDDAKPSDRLVVFP